jgi:capsular exopolysaccharide synthesis family protein
MFKKRGKGMEQGAVGVKASQSSAVGAAKISVMNKKDEKPKAEHQGQNSGGSIAPVLKTKSSRSSLSDGVVLLPHGSIEDLQAAERFRILRGQLEQHALKSNLEGRRVYAITSAVPSEGKSVISVNLSRALGTDPRGKALLIDCDLRKPNIHRFFGLKQSQGLSDILLAGKPIKSVLHHVESGLDVITAGSPVVDSTRTIEQPGTQLLFEELKKHYQVIILDCPPSLFCSEPIALAQMASSTLLVSRSWNTEKKLVKEAINLIGKKRIGGLVLNECSDIVNQYGYYGYYGREKGLSNSGVRKAIQDQESAKKGFFKRLFNFRKKK